MKKQKRTQSVEVYSTWFRTVFGFFVFVILLSSFLLLWGVLTVSAEVAEKINYQGRLADSTGFAVADGDYDMRFYIYDAVTGGTLLWTGTHTTANGNPVTTVEGIFSVIFGEGTGNTLDLDFTSGQYFLEVEIYNTSTLGWETFNNRKELVAVPQALNANNIVGDGKIDIDNTDGSQDVASITYDPASGTNNALTVEYGGSGGTGTALEVIQSGTGDLVSLLSGATEVLRVEADGDVGIGLGGSAPSHKLDVGGDVNVSGTYRIGGVDYGQYFIDSAGTDGFYWKSDGVGRGSWASLSSINHDELTGLLDDDHTQYAHLPGRSGGQTLIGGTDVDDALTIQANDAAGNTGTATAIELLVGNNGSVNGLTIDHDGTIDFHNNPTENLRMENFDGSGGPPMCDATTLGRMYYDTDADAALVCIETSPGVYGWFDYTTTTVQSNKVVTVGTGADYSTIALGATYLNTLGGGIILLTPETHQVTTVIDLENVSIIGSNTGDTIIDINSSGLLNVKETSFKNLTVYIDAALSAGHGLNAKYDGATTTSVIFEWTDFIINGTKVLVDSNEATAPTIRSRFISTSTTAGTRKIFYPIATANLNATSTHFVESQGGAGALDIEDWNVKIAGSSNVLTDGTVETIPDSTIFVYPGMHLQGAVDSIVSGGVITLLPGTHTITDTLTVSTDDIQIEGYNDASIISASGITGGATVAAIQVGSADGTSPNDGVVLSNFRLEVAGSGGTDIHGIRVAGGEDNQITNVTVQKVSGASGTGGGARIGIHLIDGTVEQLVRPVVRGCRVFGDDGAGAYFTDGIHVTGGDSYGVGSGLYTNGTGIEGVLVEGNYVDYVRETVAVFVGVNNSSLFNNRFSRMGAGGGGAFGVFFGNSANVNMTANVVSRSLSNASYGIVIDAINTGSLKSVTDSVFTANTVDGSANGGSGFQYGIDIGNTANTEFSRNIFSNNVINGASDVTTTAMRIRGNADDNNFSNNVLNGVTNMWDTGFDLTSADIERNVLRANAFIMATTKISDSGTGTQRGVSQHQATSAPTANDDSADGYGVGTVWVDTSTITAYIATSVTVGSAVWEQIDAGAGGSGDLDDAYDNDVDKVLDVDNASGLEIASSTAGNVNVDLQSTGDFIIQDNGSDVLTVDDQGGLDYTLDATDNPDFVISNLGTGEFRINDSSGDTTPFIIDQSGNVGVGMATVTDKLGITQSVDTTNDNALGISLTQISNATNITNSAMLISAVSSGDLGDTLYGVNIDSIVANGSTQIALRLGSGWDYELAFDDSTPNIRLADGAVLGVSDGTNNLLEAKDLSTQFGLALSAGAFIDRNSSIQEDFNVSRGNTSNDSNGVNDTGIGDGGGWGVYESSNCRFFSNIDGINGLVGIQSRTNDNGCLTMIDKATNDPKFSLDADNRPVFLFKIQPDTIAAQNHVFIGMSDTTDGQTTDPTEFIGFTNNGTTAWTGRTTSGGTSTNVTCTGQTISTTQFALLMVEVVANNDVRFYVDNNVSDGISFASCGTSSTNIPTQALAPQVMWQSRAGGPTRSTLYLDFYRVWQDDSADGVSAPINLEDVEADLASESSVTQIYPSAGAQFETGTVVATDPTSLDLRVEVAQNTQNIVGVVVEHSGVEVNNNTVEGVRVATFGRALVKANDSNGNIEVGDYVTVSKKRGEVAKAVESGVVLGRALKEFDEKSGMLLVQINIEHLSLDDENIVRSSDGKNVEVAFNMSVTKGLDVEGDIKAEGEAEFKDKTFFGSIAKFFDRVLFDKEVEFSGETFHKGGLEVESGLTLDKNSAGIATIKKGETKVRVNFDKHYRHQVIVSATPRKKAELDWFRVTDESKEGFTIEINPKQKSGTDFSWIAVAVSDEVSGANDDEWDKAVANEAKEREGQLETHKPKQAKDTQETAGDAGQENEKSEEEISVVTEEEMEEIINDTTITNTIGEY